MKVDFNIHFGGSINLNINANVNIPGIQALIHIGEKLMTQAEDNAKALADLIDSNAQLTTGQQALLQEQTVLNGKVATLIVNGQAVEDALNDLKNNPPAGGITAAQLQPIIDANRAALTAVAAGTAAVKDQETQVDQAAGGLTP